MKEAKEKKQTNNFALGIILGILGNVKSILYVFATCLSGYLFYQAMLSQSWMAMICSLGFLLISYLPIWKRG